VTIQRTPEVPTINEIVTFEAIAEDGATIYEWNWTFGDGGTASGRRVWHVFRSVNEEGDGVAPWKVTVTAVDNRGNVSSSAQQVQVQPHTGHLAAYARKEAGLDVVLTDTREPEIPPQARRFSIGGSVLEEHWQIASKETLQLLLKLYMIPVDIRAVSCLWTVYACGEDGTEWPESVHQAGGGTWPNYVDEFGRVEEKWYYSYVGFHFAFGTELLDLEPGWYLVFAETTAADPAALARNVYSFKLHVIERAD
jgi:hypothetical protein